MNIPKEIKCAGHTYTVNFERNLLRNNGNRGYVLFHEETILIDDKMNEALTAIAFLHETIHVIDAIMLQSKLDEDQTEQLAEGLYQLFLGMGINFVKGE